MEEGMTERMKKDGERVEKRKAATGTWG